MLETWNRFKDEYLQFVVFGNTAEAYLVSAVIFVVLATVLTLLNAILLKRLKAYVEKTPTKHDDFLVELLSRIIIPVLYVGAAYLSIIRLDLGKSIHTILTSAAIIFSVIQITRLIVSVVVYYVNQVWVKKDQDGKAKSISKGGITLIQIVIWGVGIVFILDNLGFNVSAMVAGLGIGGVAVALAAQTILGDLFNYFVISLDKPFEEGDFIILDDYMGIIENVGIKSTRIRSLGGEQIVMANSDLTGSRIRNYKRMRQRRVLFSLGVTYQTSLENLKEIPAIIKNVIESAEDTVFDRAHFKQYGDFSLNIEVVYYVLSGDYNKYMDTQQKINLAIYEAFGKKGIEFAYPTQTVFVNRQ